MHRSPQGPTVDVLDFNVALAAARCEAPLDDEASLLLARPPRVPGELSGDLPASAPARFRPIRTGDDLAAVLTPGLLSPDLSRGC